MLLSTPGRGQGGGGRGSGGKRRACLSAPLGFWSHPGFFQDEMPLFVTVKVSLRRKLKKIAVCAWRCLLRV